MINNNAKYRRQLFLSITAVIAVAGIVIFAQLNDAASYLNVRGERRHQLPGNFTKLRFGLSQSDVLSLVGSPVAESRNKKYVHKTDKEWADLQRDADDMAKLSDANKAPSMRLIRAGAELQHRAKEIWRYQPNPHLSIVLSFDENSRLIGISSAPVAPPQPGRRMG
jgi:hypothetical protein